MKIQENGSIKQIMLSKVLQPALLILCLAATSAQYQFGQHAGQTALSSNEPSSPYSSQIGYQVPRGSGSSQELLTPATDTPSSRTLGLFGGNRGGGLLGGLLGGGSGFSGILSSLFGLGGNRNSIHPSIYPVPVAAPSYGLYSGGFGGGYPGGFGTYPAYGGFGPYYG